MIFSIIGYVYIDVWGSFCWICLLMGVRMWAPRDLSFFVFILLYVWEWDEWPSLRSSGSLSIPSLCSLLTWPPFIFDLSGSSLVLVFYASSSSSFSLLIHHFYFTSYSVLTVTSFWGLIFFSHHHYTSRHQFGFSSLHHHCYHVHNRHLQVHGSRYFLYMLHFIHEGMGFDHWVFGPSFPSFLSP